MTGPEAPEARAKSAAGGHEEAAEGHLSHAAVYGSEPMSRVDMAVKGLPAEQAKRLLDVPGLARARILAALGLPAAAAFDRKARDRRRLSTAESERVLGFARLVGQVEAMMGKEASEAKKRDGRAWFAEWILGPVPALGMRRPIDLLGTVEGQSIVSTKLGQIEAGVYA